MAHHCSLDNSVIDLIPDNLDGWEILDLGCGYGFWGLYLRMKKRGDFIITGIERFTRYVAIHNEMNIYTETYLLDVRDMSNFYYFRKYDLIICGELVEHLTKEEADVLLDKLDSMFNKMLIVTTPLGFMKTVGYDNNKYQIHKSGYDKKYFKDRGFTVKIVRMQPLSRPVRFFDFIWRKIMRRYATRKQIIAYKVKT